jgi:hypothetical protein
MSSDSDLTILLQESETEKAPKEEDQERNRNPVRSLISGTDSHSENKFLPTAENKERTKGQQSADGSADRSDPVGGLFEALAALAATTTEKSLLDAQTASVSTTEKDQVNTVTAAAVTASAVTATAVTASAAEATVVTASSALPTAFVSEANADPSITSSTLEQTQGHFSVFDAPGIVLTT